MNHGFDKPADRNPESRFDVVILGGGPAGAAAALSLKQIEPLLSIAIIEAEGYHKVRVGETLPPGGRSLLKQLGVWQSFLAQGHVPAYGTSATWGSSTLYDNEFIFSAGGSGWHLDRAKFDSMLAQQAVDKGAVLNIDCRLIASERQSGIWRLKIEAGKRPGLARRFVIEARFVIDATGRRAAFAVRHGSRKLLFDGMVGVSCTFGLGDNIPVVDSYTLVEAGENGWWYSALLPDSRMVVTFMSDADIVRRLELRSPARWLDQVRGTRDTLRRLESCNQLVSPVIYPAATQRLDRSGGEGWLAAGDAAFTVDPLSSQGIHKALSSGVLASYAVADYFKNKTGGFEKYQAILEREFKDYLLTRTDFYREERRWPQSIFWRRRHRIPLRSRSGASISA